MSTPAAKKLKRAVRMPEWLASSSNFQDRKSLDALVLDYFIAQGSAAAANAFLEETGLTISKGVLDSIEQRLQIRDLIEDGNIVSALKKIDEINTQILNENSALRFKLVKQRIVELIRQLLDDDSLLDQVLKAAQDELAPLGMENESLLSEIEEVMTLLAFRDPYSSPIAVLLETKRRAILSREVDTAILESQDQAKEPAILNLAKTMKWSERRLDRKEIKFPHMKNILTGELAEDEYEDNSKDRTFSSRELAYMSARQNQLDRKDFIHWMSLT